MHLGWILLLGSSWIPRAYAQANHPLLSTPLPSAEVILDRSVAVTGGQAGYDRIQNEVRSITAKMSGAPVAQIVMYRTRSGNLHQIMRAAGGQSELGVRGGVVWSRTGDAAQILETGEERAQALQAAVLLSEGRWREFYKSAETVGMDAVEGKLCYVLKAVPVAGEPHTLWYDQKTGLQVREVAPLPTGGTTEMTAQDYFDAGGVKIPRAFLMRSQLNLPVITMVVDDVKFNQQIPDSVFALPTDIERLMKKRFAAK
jgi:hypothetical protein